MDRDMPVPELGEMDVLVERLHGLVGTAGDLCGIAARVANKLVGKEPARPGGSLGFLHGQVDEMEGRLRALDYNLTHIARL